MTISSVKGGGDIAQVQDVVHVNQVDGGCAGVLSTCCIRTILQPAAARLKLGCNHASNSNSNPTTGNIIEMFQMSRDDRNAVMKQQPEYQPAELLFYKVRYCN